MGSESFSEFVPFRGSKIRSGLRLASLERDVKGCEDGDMVGYRGGMGWQGGTVGERLEEIICAKDIVSARIILTVQGFEGG